MSDTLCVFLSKGSFERLNISGSEGDRAVEQAGMLQTLHSTNFSVHSWPRWIGLGGAGFPPVFDVLCVVLSKGSF